MAKLKVKTESLPERCEICHQTDYFDALNNYCSRCSGLKIVVKPPELVNPRNPSNNQEISYKNTIAWITCVFLFIGSMLGLVEYKDVDGGNLLLILLLSLGNSLIYGIIGLVLGLIIALAMYLGKTIRKNVN